MELKINKGEFAAFKGVAVHAIYHNGRLALESFDVSRVNVPFETVEPERDSEFSGEVFCTFYPDAIRGAAEFLRAKAWQVFGGHYPAIPAPESMNHAVSFGGMKETVKYIREYASEDDGRPNLKGVHLAVHGGSVDVVATNGHILCMDTATNTADNPGGDFAVTVSNYCLDAALKLVGKKGDLGTMRVQGKFVSFDGLPDYLFRGVIDMEYPEFRRVIPAGSDYPLDFTADRVSLREFAKVAKKAAEKSKAPLVTLIPAVGGLLPTFSDGNMETVSCETLAIPETPDAWTGMKIAYNAGYLLTILSGFVAEKVRFCVKGEASATSIREGNRVAVLMPVRL